MKNAANWLHETLRYKFRNSELFLQALTHRSASNSNNERLEFLGDAILDFVISDVVYAARPDAVEGDLSKLRSSLVRDKTLAELALELDLGEHLILGSGEMKSGGHRRKSILADALEAIFGAIYLDTGIDAAREVIERVYAERIEHLPDARDLLDAKTRLQEWLQARKIELPKYDLVQTTGKDHQRLFSVTCAVPDRSLLTEGKSTTRRKAEQIAARQMMKQLIGDQE